MVSWFDLLAGAMAGGGITAGFNWLANRTKLRHAEVTDAGLLRKELIEIINAQQADITSMRTRMDCLETDLCASRTDCHKIRDEAQAMRFQNNAQQSELDKMQRQIDDLNLANAELHVEIKELCEQQK